MNRKEEARERKLSGRYSCTQAVCTTYHEAAGVSEEMMMGCGAAFGSGMGCLEGTCGAIVGTGIVLGMYHKGDRVKATQGMRRIMKKFQARNDATVCKVLKGVGTGKVLRACDDCVADAAEFLEEELGL